MATEANIDRLGGDIVIRLNDDGYYGSKPFAAMPREEAIVFPTMKEARRQLNRLNGRLMKGGNATIEANTDYLFSQGSRLHSSSGSLPFPPSSPPSKPN